jgi:hypothetical protein
MLTEIAIWKKENQKKEIANSIKMSSTKFIALYTVWNVWDEGGTMHEKCFKGTSNFTTNDCHINMTGERKET